jgi:hypothetical protein
MFLWAKVAAIEADLVFNSLESGGIKTGVVDAFPED